MCGIIGYIGQRPAAPILLAGLKKMEYRGYDSAGMGLANGKEIVLIKRKGEVSRLEKAMLDEDIINNSNSVGVAHTRWATHGEPNEVNAHPHIDNNNQIAIVHNGIIENYDSLRRLLEKDGCQLRSETDSELVAQLIAKFYQTDLMAAVKKTLKLIEGSYGLAIIDYRGDKIIAARRSSPLVIGLGEGESLVASDPLALMAHTKKIIYLRDDEIAEIRADGYHVENFAGEKTDHEVFKIKLRAEEIEKGNFKHFMLKEIFDQPQSLKNLLVGRVKEGKIKLSLDLPSQKWRRIVLSACGTSWHSCLIGKYFLEKFINLPVEVDYASEFRYRQPIIGPTDLFVAVSQSGETADTLAALREAKDKGAQTLGIINVVGSTISREVDTGIYLHAGPEIGVASTKAFSSQVLAFLLLALYWRQNEKKAIDQKLIKEIERLPELVSEALKKDKEIKEIAKDFKSANNFLYLGRGINFPVALEGALKLKEISYIHAEGYPAAEIKHGPIALVDKNMPILFLATSDSLLEKVISNMQEIKARGGRIISIIDEERSELVSLSDYLILVPKTIPELSSIINSIPLQLLAYHIADQKNLNVDRPRNLAKSVTVE